MGFTVKIRSKHMIKPSSPTPKHLNPVKLSVLDQFSACVHMPLIFYYPYCPMNQTDSSQIDKLLKQSLSQTLVDFYPFAGRIDHDNSLVIRCNDEGVEYCEADVSTSLTQLLQNLNNVDQLLKLLPFPPATATKKSLLAVIQVNHFTCGAMAISVCTSHKIADAATLVAFVNAWATRARRGAAPESDHSSVQPKFNAGTIFPPIESMPEIDIRQEKVVCKRLVFDKEKLDTLEHIYGVAVGGRVDNGTKAGSLSRPPTRAALVTAYIWMQLIKGARMTTNPPKTFAACQAINLRAIASTPVPMNCYGNLYWVAIADAPVAVTATTDIEEYPQLVHKLRAAVKQIDSNYIEKLRSEESLFEVIESFNFMLADDVENCGFSNCLKFPIYQVDFGWGKPTWVSTAPLPFQTVILWSTKCGQGIEAWVNMVEHEGNYILYREFNSLTSSITTVRPRL